MSFSRLSIFPYPQFWIKSQCHFSKHDQIRCTLLDSERAEPTCLFLNGFSLKAVQNFLFHPLILL